MAEVKRRQRKQRTVMLHLEVQTGKPLALFRGELARAGFEAALQGLLDEPDARVTQVTAQVAQPPRTR